MPIGQMAKSRELVAERAFRWWAALEIQTDQHQSEAAKEHLIKAIRLAVTDGCWQAEVKNLKKGFRLPDL